MKTHITVLREEAVEALAIRPSSCVVDATLGKGGHTHEICTRLDEHGVLVALDADKVAVQEAEALLQTQVCKKYLRVGNFRNIDSILETVGIQEVDAVLADLGWRMEQFSGNGKGFSFQVDEPLVMTYGDPEMYSFTAHDIVNEWDEKDIANVLKGYGEERYARQIARAIVKRREQFTIQTTQDLVRIIEASVPGHYRHGRINPATRTFQALRIAVNDELDALEEFIGKSIKLLKDSGRLAIITFHSAEDRIVKHLFRQLERDHIGRVCTKRPITPTKEEVAQNPRARSAKLRIFEKHEEV